jgi:hypothetical protein
VEGTTTEDLWSASFFPGDRFGYNPWRMTITTTDREIGIVIGVNVDGSPWGLETNDDVHNFYREDPKPHSPHKKNANNKPSKSLKLCDKPSKPSPNAGSADS